MLPSALSKFTNINTTWRPNVSQLPTIKVVNEIMEDHEFQCIKCIPDILKQHHLAAVKQVMLNNEAVIEKTTKEAMIARYDQEFTQGVIEEARARALDIAFIALGVEAEKKRLKKAKQELYTSVTNEVIEAERLRSWNAAWAQSFSAFSFGARPFYPPLPNELRISSAGSIAASTTQFL